MGGDILVLCKDSGGREGGIESEESGASEAKEYFVEKKIIVKIIEINRIFVMRLRVICLYKDGV